MTRSARHTVLSETDPFTKHGDLRVVIEAPRGSRNKYSYDSRMRLHAALDRAARGSDLPLRFGFAPSIVGDEARKPIEAGMKSFKKKRRKS